MLVIGVGCVTTGLLLTVVVGALVLDAALVSLTLTAVLDTTTSATVVVAAVLTLACWAKVAHPPMAPSTAAVVIAVLRLAVSCWWPVVVLRCTVIAPLFNAGLANLGCCPAWVIHSIVPTYLGHLWIWCSPCVDGG